MLPEKIVEETQIKFIYVNNIQQHIRTHKKLLFIYTVLQIICCIDFNTS